MQVADAGDAAANAFGRRVQPVGGDRGVVQPVGALPQRYAAGTQPAVYRALGQGGQLADGVNAAACQNPGSCPADADDILHRQRPDDIPEVLLGHKGDSVRLFEIASQLGKGFIEADADRDSQPRFLPDGPPDLLGDLLPRAEQQAGAADVKPAFVDAKGLDQVGIAAVNGAHLPGEFHVFAVVRRHDCERWALLPRLPDGFAGRDAVLLGQLVFGQHDAVALRRVAADSYRPQQRVEQTFHTGKIIIEIRMKNGALH